PAGPPGPAQGTARPVAASAAVPVASRATPPNDFAAPPPAVSAPRSRVYGSPAPPPVEEVPEPAQLRDDQAAQADWPQAYADRPDAQPDWHAAPEPPGYPHAQPDWQDAEPAGPPDRPEYPYAEQDRQPAQPDWPQAETGYPGPAAHRGAAAVGAPAPPPGLPDWPGDPHREAADPFAAGAAPYADPFGPGQGGLGQGGPGQHGLGQGAGFAPGPVGRVGPPAGGMYGSPAQPDRFDTFRPAEQPLATPRVETDAKAEAEPTPQVRNGRVLLAVLTAAALLLVVPFGIVWLATRGSDGGFPVNSCVRQAGSEAAPVRCGEQGSFQIVSKVDDQAKCPDANQPVAVLPNKNLVLCLRPYVAG
ncbi:MAG TPA: hypothetical protein VES42_24845, partial [Pilimelia sp.]|nr:hypothetical protein [Pilimelia sp.]